MNYFSDTFGLVIKNDPTTENGGLFFAHFLTLKVMLGLPLTTEDRELFSNKMFHAYQKKGLYLRSEQHTDRTVSQDEITGFVVTSYLLKTFHAKDVWDYLSEHWGNYPATGNTKFYNPGDYYSWSLLCDSKLSPILAPWYALNLLISSSKAKENTSSKLIYLTELYSMKDKSLFSKILYKLFIYKMKKMYGEYWVKELYAIYFHNEDSDHPLIELSRRVT